MDDFDMGLLDDTTYKVSVLKQNMLSIAPSFLYRLPGEKMKGGEYYADEWNLRKPLKQCSLRIQRRGDILLVVFSYKDDGSPPALFAVSKIDLAHSGEDMSHFVRRAADSSRYFVIRVTDDTGDREALLGLGFIERDEAADFWQCLENYANAIARERLTYAQGMAHQ